MEFCDFQCNEMMYKRCGFCKKKFCFQHGGMLDLRFESYPPDHPRQDLNIHRSVLALHGEHSQQSFGGGSATCRHFFEQVLPQAVFPKGLVNNFCNGCISSLKKFYLRKLEEGFFPVLRKVKADGFICEVREFCFNDVHNGAKCFLCAKRSCYNHARRCAQRSCGQIICVLDPCEIKHCAGHPYQGNRKLVGLL